MVADKDGNILYMSKDEEETHESIDVFKRNHKNAILDFLGVVEVDDDLGLEIVQKPTIWQKYGVNCDPDDSNFHKSLYDQFERKGYLSPKQVKALS